MGNGVGGGAAPAPAVAYAIQLLQLLRSASPEQLGVSELARRLGLGKASTHRILTTLVDEGCLVLNPVTKAYSLGPALIALGQAASGSADLLDAVRSVLPALAERSMLAATAFRAVPNAARLVAVANASSPGPFSVIQPLGYSFPLAPTMGTLEFAFASASKLESLVAEAEAKGFLGSSLDREALFQDIVDIRRQGFAWSVAFGGNIDAGRADVHSWLKDAEAYGLTRKTSLGREHYLSQIERYAGSAPEASRAPAPLFGLAVPIFDADGDHILHLTIHGFLNQAPPDRASDLAALAKQAAREVMVLIGGREPSAEELARI